MCKSWKTLSLTHYIPFLPMFSVLLAASAFNPRVLYIHSDGYMIVKQFIHLNLFAVGFFKKPQWKWKSFKQLVSSRYQKGYPSCRYEKLTFTSIERMFCYFMIKLIIQESWYPLWPCRGKRGISWKTSYLKIFNVNCLKGNVYKFY